MKYKLIKSTIDKYNAIEQILYNRDIKEEDFYHYLNTTDNDINEPELLGENLLAAAAKILVTNISQNKKAIIIVDSDCDGYCSSSILINYLHEIFPAWVENKLEYFIHSGKQHGLLDCTDYILQNDFSLVLVPDGRK